MNATMAATLERSDERDHYQARILKAERAGFCRGLTVGRREGYELAERHMAADWRAAATPLASAGPDVAELELRRWGGPREDFGKPRSGDYPGGPLPAEMPGAVWLGGPPVHHHQCTGACYAFKPGPYAQADADRIMATLPGRGGEAR